MQQAVALQSIIHVPSERVIDPNFGAFVASWRSELELLRAMFADADDAPQAMRQDLAERLFPSFSRWMNARLSKLAALVAHFDRNAAHTHGAYLREQLAPFIASSEFLRRTNERPRGYAGDSEMMRMIYDADFRGDAVMAKWLHRHPLECAPARAVRARIGYVADAYRRTLARHDRRVRVLSIACGPARELREMVTCTEDAARSAFVFADQDSAALAEARDEIARCERRIGQALDARTQQLSVRGLLKHELALGQFELIYAMGLFDYLDAEVATKLLKKLVAQLAPGGVLLIGNFHEGMEGRAYLDYWMNWPLIYRDVPAMLALLGDERGVRAHVSFEDTGSQMFLTVERTLAPLDR